MRIKLVLENEVGIKSRKSWFLFDEGSCVKIADITYLISKRFYRGGVRISLELDGFALPSQEDSNIIRDNDTITVRFIPPSTSSSQDSCSASEEEKKLKNENTLKINDRSKNMIPVKKTIVAKKKRIGIVSAALKKVAATVSSKSSKSGVNVSKKTAANMLMKTDIKKTAESLWRKSDRGNNPSCSKSNIATKKKSSTDSSDSSSLSTDEQKGKSIRKPVENKMKVVKGNDERKLQPANKKAKVVPANAKRNILPTSQQNTKKVTPLSKLGIQNVKKDDSSSDSTDSSSSSSDEETKPKSCPIKNKTKAPVAIKKAVSISKPSASKITKKDSSGDSIDSSSSSSDEVPVEKTNKKVVLGLGIKSKTILPDSTKKPVPSDINGKKDKLKPALTNKHAEGKKKIEKKNQSNMTRKSSSSSDSSDSSSDSSDDKQKKINVDFHVSKETNHSTPKNTSCRDNVLQNHQPVNFGNSSKAKLLAAKDVYKNKSQFVVSKPYLKNVEKKEPSNHDTSKHLDIENHEMDQNNEKLNGSTDFSNSFNSINTSVIGVSTNRIQRRRQRRKENKRNFLLQKNAEKQSLNNGTGSVHLNGDLPDEKSMGVIDSENSNAPLITENKHDVESSITNGDHTVLCKSKDGENSRIDIEGDKICNKNYASFEKLNNPPEVGTMLGYRVLEISPMTYTPEVSDYKEACIKSYNKETDIVELEVSEESQSKSNGHVEGKFEMPSEGNMEESPPESERTLFLKWNELIEPCLII